jgi:hypothetical protein
MNDRQLTKADLIALLNAYLQLLPPRYQSLQSHISIYVTLVSGIFAVTVAGVKDFKAFPVNIFLLTGPILIVMLSHYAKVIIRKQNAHIKELVVLTAKLEYQLGLYDNSQERVDLIADKPWSEDNSLLPPKWVNSRLKSGKKSIEFIEEFQPSSSTTYYSVFSIFQCIALILAVLIIIFPFI